MLPGGSCANRKTATPPTSSATLKPAELSGKMPDTAGNMPALPKECRARMITSEDNHFSREHFPEPQSAQTKKQIRHHDKHYKGWPRYEKRYAAQNDRHDKRTERLAG